MPFQGVVTCYSNPIYSSLYVHAAFNLDTEQKEKKEKKKTYNTQGVKGMGCLSRG